MKRKVLFLTGTRADFGKLKPLISSLYDKENFEVHLFVTGMHQLKLYGSTYLEVERVYSKNLYHYVNQYINEPMEAILANTITGLSRFVHEKRPDMIVVHGDRVEAMAGAIVGIIQNILVCHIEGGERSGTVDEMIRHSVTKLSHFHFVANDEAKNRILQLGEKPEHTFVIGSPDIDIMISNELPSLEEVKKYYEINFDSYAIAMFHPVTTENEHMSDYAHAFTDALIESGKNYVVIFPNNDEGSHYILEAYKKLKNNNRFKIYPSINFERFLTLLKFAEFIVGNSSAGIREAPIYSVPTVNIGSRQNGRFVNPSIINVSYNKEEIVAAILTEKSVSLVGEPEFFGNGNSAELFEAILQSDLIWTAEKQKYFIDAF